MLLYKDNEEDDGSKNVNNVQRRSTLLNSDNELHKQREKMTRQRQWRVKIMERTMAN